MQQLVGTHVNQRFIERSLYSGRRTSSRVGALFPTFQEYCERAAEGLSQGGMVWERIASVESLEYDGLVYDFTVEHVDHNFIANGFVVSNCGVRLMRSNLFYREVKPHLRPLVEELFRQVPTGVGKSGKYHFGEKELRQLLAEGSRYVIQRGLGTSGDIEYTEAGGRLEGADPDVVSDRALRAEPNSAAHSARAITSSKSRWSITSLMKRRRRCWGWKRTWFAS